MNGEHSWNKSELLGYSRWIKDRALIWTRTIS